MSAEFDLHLLGLRGVILLRIGDAAAGDDSVEVLFRDDFVWVWLAQAPMRNKGRAGLLAHFNAVAGGMGQKFRGAEKFRGMTCPMR
jgi:hypothetical protein